MATWRSDAMSEYAPLQDIPPRCSMTGPERSEEGLIKETINIGAKGYAAKPFTRGELLKAIQELR